MTNIENIIYEIRGHYVMLDSEISTTKWHRNKDIYDMKVNTMK